MGEEGNVFDSFLLPLNFHSFSLVLDFLCGSVMGGLIYLRLFHTEGPRCGCFCFPQVGVVLIDDASCALRGLLVTETPRRHGSTLQEGLHWLDRLKSINILWFCKLCCFVG